MKGARIRQSLENQPMTNSSPNTQSWWKTFLDFLWDGGYRSTIVLTVTLGAIGITVYSDKLCRPMPTAVQPPAATPGEPQVVAAVPNPICGKYFELAFMVVGGYLGLSTSKTTRTQPPGTQPPNGGEPGGPSVPPPINNQIQEEGAGDTTPGPNVTTTQTASPEQPPVPTSPAPGAVQTVLPPAEAVGGDGDARSQADNPDNPQPGLQQASQQLTGFSRGGGGA